jgi:hypothetical protein
MKQDIHGEDIIDNALCTLLPHTVITPEVPTLPSHARKKLRKKEHSLCHWFDGPYDTARGEAALWTAVITQALMDGMSKSNNPEQRYHKQVAIQWLTGGSKDFHMVCLMAGLDPGYVRSKSKKALFSVSPWRAPPGKGARYLERKAYRERHNKSEKQAVQEQPEPARAAILTGPWQ